MSKGSRKAAESAMGATLRMALSELLQYVYSIAKPASLAQSITQ